jgi:hypothetical protein
MYEGKLPHHVAFLLLFLTCIFICSRMSTENQNNPCATDPFRYFHEQADHLLDNISISDLA